MPPWRLPARLDNFFPECWVGFLPFVRTLSFVRCLRAVVSPFADFAYELPGHDRFEVNIERGPYTTMWAPWY